MTEGETELQSRVPGLVIQAFCVLAHCTAQQAIVLFPQAALRGRRSVRLQTLPCITNSRREQDGTAQECHFVKGGGRSETEQVLPHPARSHTGTDPGDRGRTPSCFPVEQVPAAGGRHTKEHPHGDCQGFEWYSVLSTQVRLAVLAELSQSKLCPQQRRADSTVPILNNILLVTYLLLVGFILLVNPISRPGISNRLQ